MATYQEQYIYSVQVMGAAQAIAQLQQLQQMTNQVQSQNVGNVAGQGGAQAGQAWGNSFASTAQRAMTNMLVYGAIGAGFAAIAGSVMTWKEANVALSDSLAQLQINLGSTRKEAEAYYWQMQQMAFTTGQDVSESVYAKTIEQRINKPGLAQGGMEFGLVFPEVPVQDAVNNLLALQIQFGSSFGEINEVLLDTVQASGLTAKELLNLSDTWGPLSQELGMLDAQGQRSTEGMRNISGLMAGMATVMGESGSTIENFLRKMSQFYTNPDIKAFLAQRGIETTSGKTAGGLDIRVPFMELMAQISAQAKQESGFTVGLQSFFPNQLGQPTQQQLQELIRNWDTISGIMEKADDPVKEWGNAVEVSSQRASVAIERLGTAFSGFFAALGGNEQFVDFINSLASGLQNQAIRLSGPQAGYTNAYQTVSNYADPGGTKSRLYGEMSQNSYSIVDRLENFLEAKSGDNLVSQITERRAEEILRNFQIPKDVATGNPQVTDSYISGVMRAFSSSEFFDPKENGATMAASFVEYINSSTFNEKAAVKMALAGGGEQAVSQAATPTYSTGPIDYSFSQLPMMSIYEAADGLDTVNLSAVNASYSVDALSAAAGSAAGALNVFSMQRVDIGDATVAQITGQYERDKLAGKRFAERNGLNYDLEETPTLLYK
ncbi:MAG: hypothetical protein WBC34_05395, partial [Thiofilum sp.]